MKYYHSYLICLAACHVLSTVYAAQDSKYFKVPHNANKQLYDVDRPTRLVDNTKDPDMVLLKGVQDEFFRVIANTSLGTEFNGFTDILVILNSEAGQTLAVLFGKGMAIGYQKQNPFELLYEFWDEFQYQLPHELSEALVDYTDFAKGFDISLIPMTLDLLFQKDHLGNNLAQLPIGQVIDMVQPTASKYGIDIRAFVNGIIGKGDTTFPDLLQNAMNNINLVSVVNTLAKFMPKDFNSNAIGPSGSTKAVEMERTLQLFKPLIVNLLKSNQIDLEADAVIQVLIPFAGAAGELVTRYFDGVDSSGFNLAMLTPIIGVLNSFNGKDSNPVALIADLIGSMDSKGGNGLTNLLNMASQFMGAKKKAGKSGGLDMSSLLELAGRLGGEEEGGLDVNSLWKTAASLLSPDKEGVKGGQNIFGLLGKLSKGESIDTGEVLETAASLVKNLQSSNKEEKETGTEHQNYGIEERGKPEDISTFADLLRPLLASIRNDKSMQYKINDAIEELKSILNKKNIDTSSVEKFLKSISGLKQLPESINMEVINYFLSFSHSQFAEFVHKLGDPMFRSAAVSHATTPAAQVVSMFASYDFDKQMDSLKYNITSGLRWFGINDVTVDNFADKIRVPIQIFLKMNSIDLEVKPLLAPFKRMVRNTLQWKEDTTQYIRNIPKQKLADVVSESLDKDVYLPIYEAFLAYDISKKNTQEGNTQEGCLARAICDVIVKTESSTPYSSLRVTSIRLASFIFGLVEKSMDLDLLSIGDLFVTSFSTYEDCQNTVFCSKGGIYDNSRSDTADKLHAEL